MPEPRSWLRTATSVDIGAARLGLCAAVVLALMVFWTARNGGYAPVSWLGGAIVLVVIAAWARLVFGPTRALGLRGRLALAALALYVAWSYASVLWAADKGAALTGSDRALLYLTLAWLFATLDWTRRRLELSLKAYLLGIGALALAWLVELALGPAPQLLQGGQLAAGLGYHNATAALGTIGALGSILLGSSGHSRPITRAGLAAGAAACLEVSLLADSRGWLYTLPVIVVVVVAITPGRGRALLWSVLPVGSVLVTLPWVLHGLGATGSAARAAAADVSTARAGLFAAALSGAGALLVARLQRRYVLSPRGRRVTRTAGRVLAVSAAAAAVGAAALAIGTGAAARGWHQFTADTPVVSGVQRFGELGSGRYDFWRVALKGFADHPLGGLGQDNFAQPYVAARHTGEEPAWVHSLELRLLAHTGAIGFALFAAFLALALFAYRLATRDADRRLRLALAAALVPFVVWAVHGSVDWFWEIPALSAPAFAFLGAAIALEPGRERRRGVRRVPVRRLGVRRLRVPRVGLPGVRVPRVGLPGVRVPSVRLPSVRLPSVRLPSVRLPSVRLPSVGVPRVGLRRIRVPRVGVSLIAPLAGAAIPLALFGSAYVGERALTNGQALAASRPTAALQQLSLAAQLEPFNSAPVALEAGIQLRAGHALSALRLAETGLRRDEGNWVLALEDGLAAGAAGRPALERTALARAHTLDPREPVIELAQRRAGTSHPLTITEAAAMLATRAQARVAP